MHYMTHGEVAALLWDIANEILKSKLFTPIEIQVYTRNETQLLYGKIKNVLAVQTPEPSLMTRDLKSSLES